MKSFSHTHSATLATDISLAKNSPFRPWRAPFASQFPITNLPFRPWRPWRAPSAFSLTEVVIAMGVAAVAFTSIISLFPLGLGMSRESHEETQAAILAQSLMADLRDAGSAQAGGKLIQTNGLKDLTTGNYTNVPMSGSSSLADRFIYLAYDQKIRTDALNNPVMLRPCAADGPNEPDWFRNGTNGPNFLVKVSIKHSFRLGMGSTANPQRVDVSVEFPASLKSTNRTQYLFTGLVPQS